MPTHPFTWKSYLWVRSDAYFCQGLSRFDFTDICIFRGQWDQRLRETEENKDQANFRDWKNNINQRIAYWLLYLSAPLCHHCASVFLFVYQSQEDPVTRNGTERKSPEETVTAWPFNLSLPCNALPTSFGEGRTLLFDHTHQSWHRPGIQQLFQSLLHIGRCILLHWKIRHAKLVEKGLLCNVGEHFKLVTLGWSSGTCCFAYLASSTIWGSGFSTS